MERILGLAYVIGAIFTIFFLTFLDGYIYTAWNWIIALPVNAFLGSIWPIYWGLLHWIM